MRVSYMLMSDPRDAQGSVVPWRQFLAQAKGWGLEAVDLFPAYLECAGATVDEATRVIADLGLAIAVLCVQTDLVSADPAVREQSLGRVRATADKAAELGVAHLFSYGGQHSNKGEDALLRYVDGLQHAAAICEARGLSAFSIENAGSLCHTHEEMARCLDAVGLPHIMRLTIDTGNFVLAGSDPHEAIRRLGPRVAHVHVKNFVDAPGRTPWPFRYCPPRAGKVDYPYVVGQLRAVGYGGYVAFEPEGFPDAQAEDGIRFLAELLAAT